MSESWLGAVCAETDPELFFPEKLSNTIQIRQAKRLCATCPVAIQCLEVALKKPYEGIWGGTMPHERASMKKHPELIQQHLKELRASARTIEQAD